MSKKFALWIVIGALAACSSVAQAKRNIIATMTDDMGYSDLGCYGGPIETPHLDSLARQGLRFAQFYNTATCCPTRASLLTGLYELMGCIGRRVDMLDYPRFLR